MLSEPFEAIINAFGVIAVLYSLVLFVNYTIRQTRLYIFPMIFSQPDLKVKYGGKWAIITGGSDGIGKRSALELAERGMNICILSNFENGIVATIEKHNVMCKYIDIDFSRTDIYEEIGVKISDILDDLGILINNVGIVDTKMRSMANQSKSYFTKIINVNINAMVFMTDLVLKTFIKKNKGLILNMGSISGRIPLPYGTMYGSSKSFVEMYSVCLAAELNETNIEVKCIVPSFVKTKLVQTVTPLSKWLNFYASWCFPEPKTFCASMIRTLGHTTPVVYEGYWNHALINFFLPFYWFEKFTIANFFKWWVDNFIGLD